SLKARSTDSENLRRSTDGPASPPASACGTVETRSECAKAAVGAATNGCSSAADSSMSDRARARFCVRHPESGLFDTGGIVATAGWRVGTWHRTGGAIVTREFFTIGHSKRSGEAFIDLLRRAGVTAVADVRKLPGSRANPQFDTDALAAALAQTQIAYEHIAE